MGNPNGMLFNGRQSLSYIKDDLDKLISSQDPYNRSAAALALGQKKERERFDLLLRLLEDEGMHVRGDAITALGELRDSRATFTLVNYFEGAPGELKARSLYALERLADPRCVDFLERLLDSEFQDVARHALSNCRNNSDFEYDYDNDEKHLLRARQKDRHVLIRGQGDLDPIEDILTNDWFKKHPQTYVVTNDGLLRVGGHEQEHVCVAGGDPVLTAGEIKFEKEGDEWVVSYANNRSFGYRPHPISLVWLERSLDYAGIRPPEDFNFWEPEGGFCDSEFLSQFPMFNYHASQERI